MHVDFMTLACLCHDMAALKDAKIQQVLFTDQKTLGLELYAGFRTWLLLDTDARHARALLQDEKARRGTETESPVGLLLRKYVRGGRLRRVTQPPWERILLLEIENEEGRSTLVAEIMGKSSNLLLLDEAGTIRDCLRRATAQKNEYRTILPNHPYIPPPPLKKRPPPVLNEGDWRMMLTAADQEQALHKLLLRELTGVSPMLAREIVARVTGDPEAPVAEAEAAALLEVVAELFAPLTSGAWEPYIALNEEGEVIAFAPYELTQFESIEPAESISLAMQRYFAARMDTDAYAAARQRVAALLAEARKSVEGLLYQLRSQTIEPAEIEQLRENGELLLAYQWQVPKKADSVELTDYEGNPRRITLDPALSPVENAQRLFTRYDKKKRAAEEIPPRVEAAERDLSFLVALENDVQQAEERPEIEAVREALVAGGFLPSKKRRRGGGGVVRGPRRVLLGEWVALVGRNSAQNDEVTFRLATSEDIWLHARGVPGSHVILKLAGRQAPPEIIQRAASLAAYYSQARSATDVAVDVTERRHVHRISGARPGLVTYRNERTLHVRPLAAEEIDSEE
ncbi:MAG: NFACT family protein [Ardenticatenales bacterium]|nr:NFACT family protein [Ardenticatenales bacterium]